MKQRNIIWPTGQSTKPTKSTESVGWHSSACSHRDVTEVAKIGKSTIYAGSQSEVADRFIDFDLFIALNDRAVDSPIRIIDMPEDVMRQYPVLAATQVARPQILIDWKDFAPPPMGPDFFATLFNQIRTGPARKIAVYCVGGHGRTGTLIALLYHVMGKSDVVELTRSVYCAKAVETESQIAYLRSAGADVGKATGSYHWNTTRTVDTGPACDHNTCPWERCNKTKEDKAPKAEPRTSGEQGANPDTNPDISNDMQETSFGLHENIYEKCQPPFKCVYEDGDPYCIHCGAEQRWSYERRS